MGIQEGKFVLFGADGKLRKYVKVVGAIIVKDGRIFATKRGYGEFEGGWEFPGGKVEPDETPEEAIVREIREELATEIEVDSYFDTVEYDYETFHLSMDCFICHVVSGEFKLLEHEAAKWLGKGELNSVGWLPADVTLVSKLEEMWD
ncbi:MAG: (deoxy)nucleoside triphosphate pyrophosphohydrolase [Lachnospiraceae bacterium]|nr:(deoxy)nucleoside triphosphate pyrophosphohydrolase [Lachnospiraceae bacterium]